MLDHFCMCAGVSVQRQHTGNNTLLAWQHVSTFLPHYILTLHSVLQDVNLDNASHAFLSRQRGLSTSMTHVEQGLGAITSLGCFLDKQRRSADGAGEVVSSALLQPIAQAA